MGADQLVNLHTWHEWRALFSLTHLCIAARPGYQLDSAALQPEVASEVSRRQASPQQLRATPSGLSFIATHLALDCSSSALRETLSKVLSHEQARSGLQEHLPTPVLDYIQQHHLYQTT
jgi:nicotinate-nucleotide adenylyltransferase